VRVRFFPVPVQGSQIFEQVREMSWSILTHDQQTAIAELEFSKSERVAALVGCAMLDQSLRLSIECRLRADRDMLRKIFAPNGTLGDTTRKIDVAYMLSIVEKDIHGALSGIAEIRNLFAHSLSMRLDAQDPKMQSALKRLTLHEGKTEYPHPTEGRGSHVEIEPIKATLDRLIINMKFCLIALNGDVWRKGKKIDRGYGEPTFMDVFQFDNEGIRRDRHGQEVTVPHRLSMHRIQQRIRKGLQDGTLKR
jgi:hypothetical protein